jgi:DHA3 family macrolide efflux protein-like MFS transporter
MVQTQPDNNPGKNWVVSFFGIWTGQAFSILGSQLVHFALIWWLTVTTGSATVLAAATIVGILPGVLIGPLAGTLVDRWNRRLVMMLADGLVAGATAVLAILFVLGAAQAWQIYLVLLVRAIGASFHGPAMSASTSLMVPKEHLARVQGANQMLNGGLSIFSAPLGALLIEVLPLQGILAIDIGTALLAIVPLFFVHVPQPAISLASLDSHGKRPTVWMDMRAGFLYVLRWPGLLALLLMATLINMMLAPAFAMLPLLVKKVFLGGAMQLAWMESANGIGVIAGGLLLGIWGGFRRRMVTSLLGLFGISIGTLLIGVSPGAWIWLGIVAMFLVGFTVPLANGPLAAIMQAVVAPEMQGRVFTLLGSLAGAMSPLGLAMAGPLADAMGVQVWFIAGGLVTGVIGLVCLTVPAILYLEDHHQAKSAGEPGGADMEVPDLANAEG